jgi:tRNA pseudouridine55 synthase
MATGLLVVATGRATRLFPFFSACDKSYSGAIRLGFSTDTYDAWGKPTSAPCQEFPSREGVLKALKLFRGEFPQVPPPYSAKKFQGKSLYRFAREKREIQLKPVRVTIYSFRMKNYAAPFLTFEASCSSGTYIRSLAHDLGQALGCGAHLAELTRLSAGNFHLKDSFSLERIEKLLATGKTDEFLIPLDSLLPEFPRIILTEGGGARARNGNTISPGHIQSISAGPGRPLASGKREDLVFRLFDGQGKLVALARPLPAQKSLAPFLVLK